MKRTQLFVMLIFMLVFTACGGGFKGPGAVTAGDTVKSVKIMAEKAETSDDVEVVLTGNIIKQLDDEHYTFKDSTGTITVEIDKEKFLFSSVTPETKVNITGEIDKEINAVKIDVDKLKIIQ